MPKINRLQYIQGLKARAEHLHQGETASRLVATFDQALAMLKDPEAVKKSDTYLGDLLRGARDEREAKIIRGPKQMELNALRVTTIDNFMVGSSNAASFFDAVNLAEDEEPWIENTTRQETEVRYIGQDGKARKTTILKADEGTRVDLRTLSTEEIEYLVTDIYKGDMKTPAMANIDLSYDLMQQNDQLLWAQVQGLIGNDFSYTGRKTARTINFHSSVKVANLPAGNLLLPTLANGDARATTSTFDLECLKAIIEYIGKWGSNAFRDGELRLGTIFVPSGDMFGWIGQVDVDTRENPITTQIFTSGYVVNFAGTSFTIVGDNTLDPAAGLAYVQTNKSVGEFFTKTSMDKVFIDDSISNQKLNRESISMSKVVGAGLPAQKRVNAAAVRYKVAS